MVRMSKYKISEDVNEQLFHLLFEIMGKRKNQQDFFLVIPGILSKQERLMIAKRIGILYLILQKIDYSVISQVLKVSPATIAKFSMVLEQNKNINHAFSTIITYKKLGLFFVELLQTIKPPGTYGTNWSASWKRELRIKRQKEKSI